MFHNELGSLCGREPNSKGVTTSSQVYYSTFFTARKSLAPAFFACLDLRQSLCNKKIGGCHGL